VLPPTLELPVTQTPAAEEVPRNQILAPAILVEATPVEVITVQAAPVEAILVEATPVQATLAEVNPVGVIPVGVILTEATPVAPRPAESIMAEATPVKTIRAGTGTAAAIPVAGILVTVMPVTTIQQVGITPRIRVVEQARPIPKDSRTMVSTWRPSMYRKTSEFLWKTSAQK